MKQITNDQAVVLIWCCIMKQSQNTRQTLDNVELLWNKIKDFSSRSPLMCTEIEKSSIYNLTFDDVFQMFMGKRKLHRFPKKMAEFIYESIEILKTEFGYNAKQIFEEEDKIIDNLKKFKGISSHKAYICYGVYKSFLEQRVDQEYFLDCGCMIAIEDIMEEINLIASI